MVGVDDLQERNPGQETDLRFNGFYQWTSGIFFNVVV